MSPEAAGTERPLSFGQIALDNKLVSREQIVECLEEQKRDKAAGRPERRLGEILVARGFLSEPQVRTIFRLQGREGGHRQIAGYQVLEKLGAGAMGAVFRAKQLSMDRVVAMKILPPRLAKDERFVSRFLREARAVAKLSHVNIIAGIDVGESNGIYYFAMEYVDGETVGAMLRNAGGLPEARAIDLTVQVCRALEHAHKNGLIHRDIKPDNVMVSREGVAKLCDLGLARVAVPGGEAGAHETLTGQTVGTPSYLSPEVARGGTALDIRADLYSLGASLYHMLAGEPPFVGTAAVVMTRHLTEPPVPLHLRKPGVSRAASAVAMKALEKAPIDRYTTPAEMLADLERLQRGEWPIGAGPPAEGEPPPRPLGKPAPGRALPPAALPAAAVPVDDEDDGADDAPADPEAPPAAETVGPKFPRRRRRRHP